VTTPVIETPERAGRTGRPARARTTTVIAGLAVAAVVVVALSVFVGARPLSPAIVLDPSDPLFSVFDLVVDRPSSCG
jgi:hypothetical protein